MPVFFLLVLIVTLLTVGRFFTVDRDKGPASVIVEVSGLALPDFLIEIDAIAVVP